MNPVTIIIPVYADWGSLERCIDSLLHQLKNTNNPHRVLFVNDAGPDALSLEKKIKKKIKNESWMHYEKNEKNLGFGMTCNRAVLELDTTNNDILLLNSDTRVTKNFLKELTTIFALDKNIAAVSPRSNNASICTIPITSVKHKKAIKESKSYKYFRKYSKDLPPYYISPTAHGFCLLIRRDAIRKYGLFDDAFGRGYGEEVDFCQRLRRKGLLCAIANRSFVFHEEARSFTHETKKKLIERSSEIINKRYPNYTKEVGVYIQETSKKEPYRRCKLWL